MATIVSSSFVVPVEHRVKTHTLTNIPMIEAGKTIADVQALLFKHPDFDSIKFIYVIDKKQHLIGVASFRDLFRHTPQTVIDTVMEDKGLISIASHEDDERATHLALRHSLQAVPVTEHGKLIGVIPSRYLLQIFKKDAVEDVTEAQGAAKSERKELDNVLEMSIFSSVMRRLPWLVVGLLGGVFAAYIIAGFEDLLAHHLILASFIPLVVYLSGAISAQVQMFYVRDMAVFDSLPMFRYIWRHSAVVLALGLMIAIVLFLVNSLFLDIGVTAPVVSIATMAAVISAIITGIGVPFILSRLIKDPASATPPIAIITSDLLTVFLYFSTAQFFL